MILLCYKEIPLGKITQKQDGLYYTSNIDGEQKLKNSYPIFPLYDLAGSKDKKLDKLPFYISVILEMAQIPFYTKKADIKQDDTQYQILKKMSMLPLARDEFYLIWVEKK